MNTRNNTLQIVYALKNSSKRFDNYEDAILVFGCRKEREDYYYKDEWISLSASALNINNSTNRTESDGETKSFSLPNELNDHCYPSLRVLNAFSQDQKTKTYVQHIMREADGGILVARHILENNGAIYVAGGAKMARAVKDVIVDLLAVHLPNGSSGAKVLLQKLQRGGKFSIEAWS